MKKIHINKFFLNEDIIKKLYNNFGHSALGYYYAITNQLLAQENYLYELKKLNKLSRDTKIPVKKLEKFINTCCTIYTKGGTALLSKNRKYFWSSALLTGFQEGDDKRKGRSGGRRKISTEESIKLPNAEYVNLTKKQYDKLINKYGKRFINHAVNILNEWFKGNTPESQQYLNKNNYGHFRSDSWVITETKKLLRLYEYG